MRIVSWNCGGKFREKLPLIADVKSDFYINADIYVIQECENPNDEEHSKYKEYKEVVEDNFQFVDWVGDIHYKGLGIFARTANLEKIETNKEFKHFMAFKVKNSFNLLCVWAMPKYVEMIHDFFDDNCENENYKKLFNENLIMCGDFNSNKVFNGHHPKDKNHTKLNEKLEEKHLKSVYHTLTGDKHGEESQATFFQARHLNQPYHLDYFYLSEKLIGNTSLMRNDKKVKKDLPNGFEILDKGQWISLSDHLPVVFEIGENELKKFSNNGDI